MTTPRFLQIHTLHSYPAALLNRDDSGLAKRLTFGGSVRTRVSSQCLKRHWRVADDEFSLRSIAGAAEAIRSRNIVEREIIQPLRQEGGIAEDVLDAVDDAFTKNIYGTNAKVGDAPSEQSTRQPLLLGLPEVEYLRTKAEAICAEHEKDAKAAGDAANLLFTETRRNEERENFRAFRESAELPAGLEGALFGRMITSDPAANIEAAVHVAHAFTVHAEESESDYFSVVDDLQRPEEDMGAAHIGDMELTAGLFYGYVVVDVPGLVSNVAGCEADDWLDADRDMAGRIVERLTRLIASVTPGAKLGSTAPYAYADLMLIEAGSRQPRSLANAFRKPTSAQTDEAARAMADYLSKFDRAYGVHTARRAMSLEGFDFPNSVNVDMDELGSWAADITRNGEAV